MEPNTQTNIPTNPMPTTNNIPPMENIPGMQPENKSSLGGIIGTIIVIAVIILGGLYFWGKRIDEAKLQQQVMQQAEMENTTDTTPVVSEADKIKSVSNSDDINSLEAELDATNLDGLGAELDAQLE